MNPYEDNCSKCEQIKPEVELTELGRTDTFICSSCMEKHEDWGRCHICEDEHEERVYLNEDRTPIGDNRMIAAIRSRLSNSSIRDEDESDSSEKEYVLCPAHVDEVSEAIEKSDMLADMFFDQDEDEIESYYFNE